MPTSVSKISSIDCEFIKEGDLHILRNDVWCPDLNELIALKFDENQINGFTIKQLNDNSIPITDPDYAFKPSDFKKATFETDVNGFVFIAPQPDLLTNPLENIHINTVTGAIKAAVTTSGTYIISNFLITIKIYNQLNELVKKIFFKVHVHPSITSVRITPSTLSLIVGNPQIRFHLLAEFSDGVLDNIINSPGIIWNSDDTLLKVDGANGRIYVNQTDEAAAVNKGSIKVWALLPSYLTNDGDTPLATTKHKVYISPSYQGNSFLKAKLLAGSISNKKNTNITDNINILFISEGFTKSEKSVFNSIIGKIVKDIKSNQSYLPWNILPINFWSLFVSSRESEISYYYPVIPLVQKFKTDNGEVEMNVAFPIELFLVFMDTRYFKAIEEFPYLYTELPKSISTAVDESKEYLLNDLVLKIGFPTSNDLTKPLTTKINEWNVLYPNSFAPNGTQGTNDTKSVTEVVFKAWKLLAKKTVANQKDTFLGISYGSIASYNNFQSVSARDLTLSTGVSDISDRVNRKGLNNILLNLRAKHKTDLSIGHLWATPDIDMATDSNFGKDFSNVIIITKGVTNGGSNYHEKLPGWSSEHSLSLVLALKETSLFFCKTVSGSKEILIDDSVYAFPAFRIDESDIAQISATSIHELSHSYKLGDEYGGRKTDIYQNENHIINAKYNLQTKSSLLIENDINGDKIKWRWKRIKKSGILTSTPQGSSPSFVVNLKTGNGIKFAKDNEVYLKKRDIYGVNGEIIEGALSPKFKIHNISGDAITIILTDTSSSFDPQLFPANSLICVMAEDPLNSGIFYELISKKIREFITTNKKPLTGNCTTNDNDNDVQLPTELPPDLKNTTVAGMNGLMDILKAMFKYKIVGLYSGGDEHDCEVLHPTGFCLMRNLGSGQPFKHDTEKTKFSEFTVVSEFCPICRYALVNQLAPDLHDKIDSVYDFYYGWLYNL